MAIPVFFVRFTEYMSLGVLVSVGGWVESRCTYGLLILCPHTDLDMYNLISRADFMGAQSGLVDF